MLVRVGLAVGCSAVAFSVSQFIGRRGNSDNPAAPDLEQADSGSEKDLRDGDDFRKEPYSYVTIDTAPPKEEEEEVKRVNTPISPAASVTSLGSLASFASEQNADQLLLPEFGDLLSLDNNSESGGAGYGGKSRDGKKYRKVLGPLTRQVAAERNNQFSEDDDEPFIEVPEEFLLEDEAGRRASSDSFEYDFKDYVDTLANDVEELGQLRQAVRELREKEERMEGELLEYYGLKERENDIVLMEQDLKRKATEIQALTARLTAMEAKDKNERSSEASNVEALKKDLNEARTKIRDLQKQLHSESGQAKAELLMLKQTLKELQQREKERDQKERKESNKDVKKDMEIEKKLQLLKELEVEVVELRRTNKELQHQKRELIVKLGAAENQIAQLSKITEGDLVVRAEADSAALRHANEDLCKQVEGLQSSRFSEVEELVYLRWVNACLRYELRNQKAHEPGKFGALDLNKDLSPRSQARAKQLMLAYAGPEVKATVGEEDGYDSSTSEPSISSEMSDLHELSVSNESMSGRLTGRKSGLIGKLRKWGNKRGDSESFDGSGSPSSSGRSSPAHPSFRGGPVTPKGPLESIMVRNAQDGAHEITTFGARADSSPTSEYSPNSPNSPLKPVRTKSKADFSGVATSFSLMSKTAGAMDEKYPAFKDRHKAAVKRERALKKRVDEKVEEMQEKKRIERETAKMTPAEIQKRELRVPNPPPKPSAGKPATILTTPIPKTPGGGPPLPPPPPRTPGTPGPPPPPPPPGSKLPNSAANKDKMQRAPEVVEFYQSLMKRDAKKDMAAAGGNSAEARNNMVGELENRSAHLLAIKADVETQGEFVKSLATEVRGAQYTEINDVVAFVTWLDEELCFLVDERAVLKHFDWPENKADALREAAFEYQDLKKLCDEISEFEDDLRIPTDSSLKKMLAQLEKVEQSVYALLRTRDMAIARYKEYNIPTQWMMDTGLIGKIKVATVRLAKQYMKRVAAELDSLANNSDREPVREFFLLQGVRFAFRVHQFAGGFDPESMRAFEDLRNRAHKRASPVKDSSGAAAVAAESSEDLQEPPL